MLHGMRYSATASRVRARTARSSAYVSELTRLSSDVRYPATCSTSPPFHLSSNSRPHSLGPADAPPHLVCDPRRLRFQFTKAHSIVAGNPDPDILDMSGHLTSMSTDIQPDIVGVPLRGAPMSGVPANPDILDKGGGSNSQT